LALLQVCALALLGSAPANALVVKAGPTPQDDLQREARAHQAGTGLTFMVGVFIALEGTGTVSGNGASGVYLGASPDKATGYVLTSAHSFVNRQDATKTLPMKGVYLAFGPTMSKDAATAIVRASRVLVHPDFGQKSVSVLGGTRTIFAHDVAIVEFAGADAIKRIEALGRTGATFYEGKGYLSKPDLEAMIAGYGVFGTQASPTLANPLNRVYAGHTRVTHTTFNGHTGFFHFGLHADKPLPPGDDVNWTMFKTLETASIYQNPHELSDVSVSTHTRQTMFANGDSGGPLLFQTKHGLAVAGLIAGTSNGFLLNKATGEREHAIVQRFEPIMDKLTWIRNVLLGIPGTERILVPGGDPSGATGRPTGELKEEYKGKPTA
jgi:hypothetical protein